MSALVPRDDVPDDVDGLIDYLVQLIEQARNVASSQVNATLTMRNWLIGRAINTNVLRHIRADYGKQIVATLSHQLTARFGPGFDRPNINRMMKFAQLYPDREIGVSLSHQLSWSHIVAILPLESADARAFYVRRRDLGDVVDAQISHQHRLSVKVGNVRSDGAVVRPAQTGVWHLDDHRATKTAVETPRSRSASTTGCPSC